MFKSKIEDKDPSMRRWFCLLTIVASAVLVSAQARPTKTLDIYVVDVEGGNATLFIAPSGESLLIDTGNGTGFSKVYRREAPGTQ